MLKRNYLSFLFTKGVLVGGEISENAFSARFALANKFNISITGGQQYANESMIPFVAEMLGEYIPNPFYLNFPNSVRRLSPDALLFDQLLHYATTYGLGNFKEPGYSLFEENFERCAFKEKTDIKKFVILTEDEAKERLAEIISDMLLSSRPLNAVQYDILLSFITEYGYEISQCVCKDTLIRLLIDTRDTRYAKFISLSDVIKLTDLINYEIYTNTNIRKLNFKNQDRKFISNVIYSVFELGYVNIRECFEKKALWAGLLHHIHFEAKSEEQRTFASLMRGKENHSVYSEFERAMTLRDIKSAVNILKEGKGSGALLRQINYILSRCETEEDVAFVTDNLDAKNAIILIQLIIQYQSYEADEERTFMFTRYNRLRIHTETEEEVARRKSVLPKRTVNRLLKIMKNRLKDLLHGRLGKVYISPEAYDIAVPIQENTSSGGYGVLPRGSRIHLKNDKKIRAFTYWERVDDIDLSVIGLAKDGSQYEFSWRTMYEKQSEAITFSGDETSGYNGGSEYFDIDVKKFKRKYPKIKKLIFSNNIYSFKTFRDSVCRAGYMLRDIEDSGEIFEPKTVKSSFTVNCDSTFAYLFGIDLKTNDFVWLNTVRESESHVAGTTSLKFLTSYFNSTDAINLGTLFEMLATEVTKDINEADVVVSDEELSVKAECEIIRSYDFEKITRLIG